MVNFRRVDPQIKTRIEGSSERPREHCHILRLLVCYQQEKNERADKKHIVSCTSAAALLLQS